MSRTAPSVTSPATPRCFILAHKMSPKIPASVTPIASATATEPGVISSIAALVERGEDHEAGVARSSRAGMKRKVNARPTVRGCPGRIGRVPLIHVRRNPRFSRTVAIVAVDTGFSASAISLNSLMFAPVGRVFGRRRVWSLRRLHSVERANIASRVNFAPPSPGDGKAYSANVADQFVPTSCIYVPNPRVEYDHKGPRCQFARAQ